MKVYNIFRGKRSFERIRRVLPPTQNKEEPRIIYYVRLRNFTFPLLNNFCKLNEHDRKEVED